jgi:hypothetical protein
MRAGSDARSSAKNASEMRGHSLAETSLRRPISLLSTGCVWERSPREEPSSTVLTNPEEVKEVYRRHQQALLTEKNSPRTKERALNVAELVWDEEWQYGKRPPWREMWNHWK